MLSILLCFILLECQGSDNHSLWLGATGNALVHSSDAKLVAVQYRPDLSATIKKLLLKGSFPFIFSAVLILKYFEKGI